MADLNNNKYYPQTYMNQSYGYGAGSTYPQQIAQPIPQTPTQLGSINWVQGEAGARSVFVPAGGKVMLMDSETNLFYIKSSDISGIPLPLRKFRYEEVTDTEASNAPAPDTYITKDDLEARLEEFKKALGGTSNEFDL